MPPEIRVVVTREMFRDLVAGREVRIAAGTETVVVNLNLDDVPGRYTDPPEAREFVTKKGKR